jgi:hypothetical protein
MTTPMLPPSASSAMSAAEASAARTRAVAAKSRMAACGIPLPLPSPLLLPPPWSSLVQRLVVALMPPPLILLTLPPPLNAQPRPIEAPSPLVHWCLSSCLPLVCRLVVASPGVVACLRLASHFVGQPPHASILDPSSLFPPAGCHVASLCTASASRRAGAIAGVIKCTAPVRPPAHRKALSTPPQQRCAAACAQQMHRRRCPDNAALP